MSDQLFKKSRVSFSGKPLKFTDKPLKLLDTLSLVPKLNKDDALRKKLENDRKQ